MFSKNSPMQKNALLITNLATLNDVLVSETKRHKEKRVIENLDKIEAHLTHIFDLHDSDFESIMVNDKFNSQKNYVIDTNEYSPVFYNFVKLYSKIYIAAIEVKNAEIRLQASIKLYRLFKKLLSDNQYENFMSILLEKHAEIFAFALEKDSSAMHSLGYQWYCDLVFNTFRRKDVFNVHYLNRFDKQQFRYIQRIIEENKYDVFKGMVSFFHHGVGSHKFNQSKLSQFTNYESYDGFDIREMGEEYERIKTQQQLQDFLKKFSALKKEVLASDMSESSRLEQVMTLSDEIESGAHQKLFFNNLMKMVHGIGSYALYHQRYDFIKLILQFKNPKDSSTIWIGHDIYPQSLSELVFFFNKDVYGRGWKFSFQIEHSESEYYEKRYELILLAYLLYSNEEAFKVGHKYISKSFDEVEVSGIQSYVKSLLQIVDGNWSENGVKILSSTGMGFSSDDESIALIQKMKDTLNALDKECKELLETFEVNAPLIPERINEFKDGLKSQYAEDSCLKSLLCQFDLYKSALTEIHRDKHFGHNTLAPKSIFNSELSAGIDYLGGDMANSIKRGEDNRILQLVLEECESIKPSQILQSLRKFKNLSEVIILALNNPMYFRKEKGFIPDWQIKDTPFSINCFDGYYNVLDTNIPIFEVWNSMSISGVMILSKKSLPTFKQYAPCSIEEIDDIFYIQIDNLLENGELRDEIINDWINRQVIAESEKTAETEELKKKVRIQIYESFELVKSQNFQGYFLETEEE